MSNVENGRVWCCRFHPFQWWHEVGCPHMPWTPEQLKAAEKCEKHPTFVRIGCYGCANGFPAVEEMYPLEPSAAKVLRENLWDLYE